MSSFECKVSDLNGNTKTNVVKNDNKNIISNGGVNNSSFETNTIPNKTTNSKTNSSIDKFLTEKNLKIILLTTVFYFFLHSEQVLEFINGKIPSLGSSASLNSVGKIIFGLLIGIFFIVCSFFFRDP